MPHLEQLRRPVFSQWLTFFDVIEPMQCMATRYPLAKRTSSVLESHPIEILIMHPIYGVVGIGVPRLTTLLEVPLGGCGVTFHLVL